MKKIILAVAMVVGSLSSAQADTFINFGVGTSTSDAVAVGTTINVGVKEQLSYFYGEAFVDYTKETGGGDWDGSESIFKTIGGNIGLTTQGWPVDLFVFTGAAGSNMDMKIDWDEFGTFREDTWGWMWQAGCGLDIASPREGSPHSMRLQYKAFQWRYQDEPHTYTEISHTLTLGFNINILGE